MNENEAHVTFGLFHYSVAENNSQSSIQPSTVWRNRLKSQATDVKESETIFQTYSRNINRTRFAFCWDLDRKIMISVITHHTNARLISFSHPSQNSVREKCLILGKDGLLIHVYSLKSSKREGEYNKFLCNGNKICHQILQNLIYICFQMTSVLSVNQASPIKCRLMLT